MEKKWHAVYTRPNSEKKVAQILTHKKIDNYCPLNRILRPGSESKFDEVPLLSSFVFVKISEIQYQQVRRVNGIINFLYWMGSPVTIEESEVDMIRHFLDEHINVKVEKTGVGINDTLSVVMGSLMDQEDVITIKNKKATIGLPTLGYKIVGEFETTTVRVKSIENFISRSRERLRFAVGMYF